MSLEELPPEQTNDLTDEAVLSPEYDTINEPIKDSLMRDVQSIVRKLRVVLIPQRKNEFEKELKNWELWGPLLISLLFAVSLVATPTDEDKDAATLFSIIFVVMWVGSLAVTVNVSLLGGNISFFQSLCLLGYCLFPFAVVAFLGFLFSLFTPPSVVTGGKLILGLVALCWALFATVPFFRGVVSPSRMVLAVYPVGLFFGSITWLLVSG